MDKSELSPNQLVAFNLNRLRHGHEWSSMEAASRLGELLGRTISLSSYSALERSVAGRRIKRFDADEIFAVAFLFDVGLWTLFEVPEGSRVKLPGMASRVLNAKKARAVAAAPSTDALAEQIASRVTANPELWRKLQSALADALGKVLATGYPSPISLERSVRGLKDQE
jgi:hypothetical protein